MSNGYTIDKALESQIFPPWALVFNSNIAVSFDCGNPYSSKEWAYSQVGKIFLNYPKEMDNCEVQLRATTARNTWAGLNSSKASFIEPILHGLKKQKKIQHN